MSSPHISSERPDIPMNDAWLLSSRSGSFKFASLARPKIGTPNTTTANARRHNQRPRVTRDMIRRPSVAQERVFVKNFITVSDHTPRSGRSQPEFTDSAIVGAMGFSRLDTPEIMRLSSEKNPPARVAPTEIFTSFLLPAGYFAFTS